MEIEFLEITDVKYFLAQIFGEIILTKKMVHRATFWAFFHSSSHPPYRYFFSWRPTKFLKSAKAGLPDEFVKKNGPKCSSTLFVKISA
jgi:hypothetical protein